MEAPETEADSGPAIDRGSSVHLDSAAEPPAEADQMSWLAEIVDPLDSDPEECRQAFEGLATVEAELRLSIIGELSSLGPRPGAQALLRLLSNAPDAATRSAACAALERMGGDGRESVRPADSLPSIPQNRQTGGHGRDADDERSNLLPAVHERQRPRLVHCLVTPVNGLGRASVVVSVNCMEERRTAAFLCDVQRGIVDVAGEIEPESVRAGGLVDAMDRQPDADCARDVPELALGLLAGSLLLCGQAVPPPVAEWLLATLGPDFQPAGFPATIPGIDVASIDQTEMQERAASVLDACPSWLDLSALTFEMAEEIWLREGRCASDPGRDAGAYRFLFEHRLIHRLELYRRMLLWMAWLWKVSGEFELSRSALALACQLADEQFAVPSHPFTVMLTTRSLKAAQSHLGTPADPRA
jgi:hypothetical protein